ncbi:glycoside hydrolase family 5 protein [Moniliophthora roreri MCA 2997]|uniref:Glycoside hydrolase family 5 protein n=1 Tax=Moniliophthora roreri (strain MCA 2997) TaxID=1381753 RepID=V2WCT7_MONRO|nr:glycoside hydrolase family 5 protein [Moniliophthora roreri MCA 2997]
MSFIRIRGTKFVVPDGNGSEGEVILRGAGLGGWLMMENFISGFPACEFQIREALAEAIGQVKAEYFFEKFLEYFFTESDAIFYKSLGMNCIRIAINYKHFEDDMNPRVLKPDAFKHLDRAISACANQGIYTVIDLHAAPGGQSGGWHADAGIHLGKFWVHKDFQDRFIWLWTEIARRYRDNTWVAGYNLLNEPADPHPKQERLMNLYDRTIAAIQDIDPNHIIFLDGNTFSTDFSHFPDDAGTRWGSNVAFAIHDYATYGFPKFENRSSHGIYTGSDEQKEKMRKTYQGKRQWMDERGLCVWNGEWGPVYAREEYDGGKEKMEEINKRRYMVLKDQLEIYRQDRLSWSIWLYKDIGFQGMVFVSPDTPYMKHFREFLLKKYRMAADAWGADDKLVKSIYDPIVSLIKDAVPNSDDPSKRLYPPLWSTEERVTRISRTILVAEYLIQQWADMFIEFAEKDDWREQLDTLAKSFHFDNCVKRDELNGILQHSAAVSDSIV